MGMTRGTALVLTRARVVQLTGVQDLANLEADAELALTDLLVSASDAIYDQLDGDGIDPTKLSNEEVYERAVAWHFLALLAIGGYMPVPANLEPPRNAEGQADPFAWSDPHYKRVQPRLSEGDTPARAGLPIPRVRNVNDSYF